MASTTYAITPEGVTIYLPGRPHPAVTLVNQGPDTVYLSDVDIPREPWTDGHPLAAASTILWDEDQALHAACADAATLIVTGNSGAVFDASAIAGQILAQGLSARIAADISLAGVPTIDAAESIVYVEFLTAGVGGGTGTGGGGGGGGTGTGGTTAGGASGGGTGTGGTTTSPTGFIPGVSYGDGVTVEQFSAWVDSHDIGAVATWSDNSVALQEEAYSIGPGERHGNWTGIVNIAIGGIFDSDSWGAAAAGSYDGRWTTALQNIRTKWGTRVPGNLHIRLGHEYNGNFSRWKVSDSDAPNFVAAFRRFVQLQRQIIPGSVSCWSPNYGTSSLASVEATWPGANVVDVIGPDWYNGWPHGVSSADFTANLIYAPSGNPQGLGSWLAYAAAKGKPMCLPECGNPGANGDGGGGGDAPGWATAFIQWCRANGGNGPGKLWYACYFNISEGYANQYSIYGTMANQPQTAAVFKAAW